MAAKGQMWTYYTIIYISNYKWQMLHKIESKTFNIKSYRQGTPQIRELKELKI